MNKEIFDRESFEELGERHKEEKEGFINKAHGQALEENREFDEATKRITEIKGGKTKELDTKQPKTKLEGAIAEQIERAKEIIGKKNVLGPEEIEEAFGIKVEEIPAIQFGKEDLERAKALNQQLVLFVENAADGEPLTGKKLFKMTDNKTSDGKKLFYNTDWYQNENFFTKETPKLGWKLINRKVFPNSIGENYLQQTEVIIDYLQNKVFEGKALPEEYQEAIDEFNKQKNGIAKIVASGDEAEWKKAEKMLEELQITQFTRESPIEIWYRLALNEKTNKERLLPDYYAWSKACSSRGYFVYVGHFDSHGAYVEGNEPDKRLPYLGVSFARSV